MLKLVCYSLLLLFAGTLPVSAQQSGELPRKSKALYDKARAAWDKRDMEGALDLFLKLAAAEPGFAEAQLRLGQIYEFQRKPDLAEKHFRVVAALQPPAHENSPAYLSLARSLFNRQQYDSALHLFRPLKPLFRSGSNTALLLEKLITSAEFASVAIRHPLQISKTPLPDQVNFLQAQFFPVLTADHETLIFTGLSGPRNEDIYEARWKDGRWTAPRPISPALNSPNNEGTCTVSADGHTLVYTACGRPDSYGSCDLYLSRKEKEGWRQPVNLGDRVNSSGWESQPALSADGRTLYFVSDRPGGHGKTDIWKTSLDSTGTWALPVNLGKTINTPGNENAPFIHANGSTLFFSSDHLPGMGGFDIFISQAGPDGWSAPVNLGYPINTAADQVGIFITSDGKKAYYTDDQTDRSKGKSLLYTFDVPDTLYRQFVPTRYVKGIIADSRSGRPLSAAIRLYDLKSGQKVSEFTSQEGTGSFLAVLNKDSDYAFYVEKEQYLFKSMTFTLKDQDTSVQLDIPLEPVQKDRAEVLTNIYFDSGQDRLTDQSRLELHKLSDFLLRNPDISIEVAGYTDDVGHEKDNLDLSVRRARSVTEYLRQLGMSPGRLTATGYGEANPRVPNTSEENRMKNRRIEWKVR